jgi:hypothetical protein
MTKEGGAQQIMCHHLQESRRRRDTMVVYQCKHGGVLQPCPPPNFAVPNVAFAEPYAHLPQPQQSVAIIGGYAARNMQNIAAIQTNANQMGEGNADIGYELGCLHLAPPGQFIGGAVQSYYEQGHNNQDYQYQPPAED